MFKILDRYIIGKYLRTFFFVSLIFTQIGVVIDFSEKVEEFIKKDVPVNEIIFEYYLTWIPYLNSLLWPLFAMIAVIYFTSRLASQSEIISMLNAGMSFRRLLVPYLSAAAMITGLHLFANHVLVPRGNKVRLNFEHRYTDTYADKGKTKDIHMFISPTTKVYIRFYSKSDTSARDFRLEEFRDNELVSMIKANRAEWMEESGKWRLVDYEIRTFNGLEETLERHQREKIDTTLNLYPADFVRYHNQREMMTTTEIREFVDIERQRGAGNTIQFQVEAARRTAEPFAIMILTLIGVAVASRKTRGGRGIHLATGLAIGAIFIFLSKFSITFANSKAVAPAVGVWIPNIIFFLIALGLLSRAQK